MPCLVRELNPGVSIHAPREGCDVILVNAVKRPFVFQFTHPGRGATQVLWNNHPYGECFNSRTPGGVRLEPYELIIIMWCFNSRTPGGVRLSIA